MKTNWKNTFGKTTGHLAGLVLVAVLLSACDTSSALSGDDADTAFTDDTISFLAVDLGLNSSETAALSASFAKFGDGDDADREPGFLWHVAAELHATLTDEQKQALFDRIERAGARRRQGPGAGSGQGGRPGQGGFRPSGPGQNGQRGGALSRIGLTTEQEEAIKAIRESFKDEFEAVLAQRDTLTREEIKEQLEAIHEQVKAEVEGVLTAEQIQQLADMKAEAEAARAERDVQQEANREAASLVMIEVLGLTDAQVSELEALRASAEADRQTIQDLRDSGATQEEVQAAAEALREAHQAEMATILDTTQLEITMIHNALASRMGGNSGRRGGKGGPGGQNGPGGRRGQGGPGGFGGSGAVNG